MDNVTHSSNNLPLIKRVIGVTLLILGVVVVYDGYATSDMIAMASGAVSMVGGLAFFFAGRSRS